jgi:mannose-1-phosphate guanylyltransferase/phosphomannomutase
VTTCALLVELALRDAPGSTIAIPVDLPTMFEEIAKHHGGRIIRTGMEPDALIAATYSKNVIMAGDGRGQFVFPDFQCAMDGLMALGKLLEFLATQRVSIRDVISNLPAYHLAHRKVSCVWEVKPRVMRLLNEKFEAYNVQTIYGVKVNLGPQKWVLIIPDLDQPYLRVTTEAPSQSEAEALADEYVELIEKIVPLE